MSKWQKDKEGVVDGASPPPGLVSVVVQWISRVCMSVGPHGGKIFSVAVAQMITAVGFAIGTRVLTECVSPHALGQYKLAVGVIGLALALFFRPFAQFAMREYHEAEQCGRAPEFLRWASSVLSKWCVGAGIIIAVILGVYGNLYASIGALGCGVAGAVLWTQSSLSFQNGILVTENRQHLANLLRLLVQTGVPFAAAASVLMFGDSARSILVGELVLSAAVLIASQHVLARGIRACKRAAANIAINWSVEARNFVLPLSVVGAFSWVSSVSDRYILERFVSSQEVGLYAAVYGLGSQPMLMVTSISAQIVYPLLFRAAAQGRHPTQSRLQIAVGATTVCASLLAIAVAMLFGDNIINLMLAAPYRSRAQELLIWIVGAYGLVSVSSTFELRAYAKKKTSIMTIAYAAAALANICLNLRWVPQHGAGGAAKAAFFSFAIYAAVIGAISLASRNHCRRDLGLIC